MTPNSGAIVLPHFRGEAAAHVLGGEAGPDHVGKVHGDVVEDAEDTRGHGRR